jgi:hypothetical protein
MDNFLAAGYRKDQVLEVLIGVALKTMSNYLDHISPTELDPAFQAERYPHTQGPLTEPWEVQKGNVLSRAAGARKAGAMMEMGAGRNRPGASLPPLTSSGGDDSLPLQSPLRLEDLDFHTMSNETHPLHQVSHPGLRAATHGYKKGHMCA